MKTIVLSAITLLLCSKGTCQTPDTNRKIRWGFNIGTNISNPRARNIEPAGTHVQVSKSTGIRLGSMIDWRMNRHLSFSPKMEVSFNDAQITLYQNTGAETYKVYPATLEFASHLTYGLNSRKTTPYILFGPTCRLPLTGRTTMNATKATDIAIDIGIGVNRLFPFFNFAPELRYSYGLMNLSGVPAIGQLNFHTIILAFNFKD